MMMMKKIVISKNQKGYFTQTKLKTCSLTNPAVRDGADCPKMEFFIRNRFGSMSAPTPTNINDQNSRDNSFITTLNSSMQETYSLHKAQHFTQKLYYMLVHSSTKPHTLWSSTERCGQKFNIPVEILPETLLLHIVTEHKICEMSVSLFSPKLI